MNQNQVYTTLSQLYPACLYTTYKQIEALILGDTMSDFSTDQHICLIITLTFFSCLCFVTSVVADSDIAYSSWLAKFLTVLNCSWLKACYPHAFISTSGFLLMVMFNVTTFTCLYGYEPSSTLSQVVPILVGMFFCSVYTGAFIVTQNDDNQNSELPQNHPV